MLRSEPACRRRFGVASLQTRDAEHRGTLKGTFRVGFLAQVQISCFFFSYLVSLCAELYQVLRRRTTITRWLVLGFTGAGLIAHTAYLLTRSRVSGLPPLMSSSQDWLLVLAWLGVLLYLTLLVTHKTLAHGLFMLPAVLLLVTVAIFVSTDATGDPHRMATRRWGMLHATTLVLGMAAVCAATLASVMYLLHHQKLRGRSGWLRKIQLPSLEQLTAVNRISVIVSVPLLTIGLITGFLLLAMSRGQTEVIAFRWSDPTILATVFFWLLMVGLLVRLLTTRRQSGKAVAQLSLLSGGFLLITILGPMILAARGGLDTFHGQGSRVASPVNVAPAGDKP